MTFFPPSGLGRPLLLDGAMGTMLQASGLPAGVSPEEFCMENPQILQNIHRAYLEAGADIITTCTFGASAYKLPRSLDVFRFNKRMAEVARAAAAASPRVTVPPPTPSLTAKKAARATAAKRRKRKAPGGRSCSSPCW